MAATREEFFEDIHGSPNHEYLGYSAIGLRTERISQVDFQDVSIRGQVSTNVWLRNPIIGAAMNCISEAAMGIAMAKVGGAAFLHHANTPEEQKTMAEDVYHYMAGIIESPLYAREDQTVGEALTELSGRGKTFRTLPVINNEGRCVGLMDKTVFGLFGTDPDTAIADAMLPFERLEVGEAGMDPHQVYARMKADKIGRLVLLDSSRRLSGLCLLEDVSRVVESNPDEFSLDDEGRLITFASVPTIPDEAVYRANLLKKYVKIIGIDTSHGEAMHAVETLRALRENVTGVDFVAGNISTEQAAIQIAQEEPDGMQVGQGPGEICVSSDRLGFGTPQASAVYEVSKGARSVRSDMPIIADGGIRDSADTMKAFACGATAVKVGNLIAATDETPVATERDERGVQVRPYWGMGSKRAQLAFAAARARYGQYGAAKKIVFIEGFEKLIPLKGRVADVIEEHVMGVRLSMAAQGMADIQDLQENARFMRGSNSKVA